MKLSFFNLSNEVSNIETSDNYSFIISIKGFQ